MKELFEKQKKLDDLIVNNLCKRVNMDITHRQLLDKRLLATYVEIGEFMEEQDHQKKLDEAIDVLHFLLSDGLALNIEKCATKHTINILYAKAKVNNQDNAIKDFLVKFSIFVNTTKVMKYWSVNIGINQPNLERQYLKCFIAYFGMCKAMNYSIEDIKAAYETKNEINYKRQENFY